MKFIRKKERWGNEQFVGKKKGFTFSYSIHKAVYIICINNSKKDIRYNSLWEDNFFMTKEQAELFCENFDYKKHKCLGKGI